MTTIPSSVRPRKGRTSRLLVLIHTLLLIFTLALATMLFRDPVPPSDEERVAYGMNTEGALLNLDFEAPLPLPLTSAGARAAWSTPAAALTSAAVFPEKSLVVGGNERNRFLVRKFSAGSFNTSNTALRNTAVLRWSLAEPQQELYVAYRVRTSRGFDPGKGGKLPGLCGGTCPTGGERPREGAHAVGWSSRIMWGASGGFNEYLYWADQPGEYGRGIPLRGSPTAPAFNDGEWHIVQQYVRMNDPGQSNGQLRASINGTVYLERDDLRFRDDDSFSIDTFLFSNFFGGHDPTWASPIDQRIYFDDIVVSPHAIVREY